MTAYQESMGSCYSAEEFVAGVLGKPAWVTAIDEVVHVDQVFVVVVAVKCWVFFQADYHVFREEGTIWPVKIKEIFEVVK